MQLTEIVYYPKIHARPQRLKPPISATPACRTTANGWWPRLTACFSPRASCRICCCGRQSRIQDGPRFTAPDGSRRRVYHHEFTQAAEVAVWKDRFEARHGSSSTDEWLSQQLGVACRLYYLGNPSRRVLSFAQNPAFICRWRALSAHQQRLAYPAQQPV